MADRVECVVIGAGVVGLAVARALALPGREVLLLEAESHAGHDHLGAQQRRDPRRVVLRTRQFQGALLRRRQPRVVRLLRATRRRSSELRQAHRSPTAPTKNRYCSTCWSARASMTSTACACCRPPRPTRWSPRCVARRRCIARPAASSTSIPTCSPCRATWKTPAARWCPTAAVASAGAARGRFPRAHRR